MVPGSKQNIMTTSNQDHKKSHTPSNIPIKLFPTSVLNFSRYRVRSSHVAILSNSTLIADSKIDLFRPTENDSSCLNHLTQTFTLRKSSSDARRPFHFSVLAADQMNFLSDEKVQFVCVKPPRRTDGQPRC